MPPKKPKLMNGIHLKYSEDEKQAGQNDQMNDDDDEEENHLCDSGLNEVSITHRHFIERDYTKLKKRNHSKSASHKAMPSQEHDIESANSKGGKENKLHYNDCDSVISAAQDCEQHNDELNESNKKLLSEDYNDPELKPIILDVLEKERELELKAKKNNLSARSVKQIIKAVITDEEVLKMVDFSLQKTSEKPAYELKLTRAKTKELKGIDQNAIWNIPVVPPKNSDIEALITQDLPEDSSDEEYEPQDECSDAESKASEGLLEEDGVDLDTSVRTISSVEDNAVENIGQRTRSKLSLSETPLEAIEQSFIPPDITTDMYNTDCDNADWVNFLKEFMQPLGSSQPETVDDDNDPEYNVMIDEEHEATDKEELREDRAVKVTKKELNDLLSELAEYTEMLSSDDEEDINKNDNRDCKKVEDENLPKENVTFTLVTEVMGQFSEMQCLILKQQLQQHVQLLLQSYLLFSGNPSNEFDATECKTRLQELDNFRKMKSNSFFNVLNLDSSMNLINEWSTFLSNPVNSEDIENFMDEELEKVEKYRVTKVRYRPKLPEQLIKMCLRSDAFIYPLFLPPGGFSEFTISNRCRFTPNEEQLIAMGLEQFSQFLGSNLELKQDFHEVVSYIQHYLVPVKTVDQIMGRIKQLSKDIKSNPVKIFFTTKKAPVVEHFVVEHTALKILSDNPEEYFPESWSDYLSD